MWQYVRVARNVWNQKVMQHLRDAERREFEEDVSKCGAFRAHNLVTDEDGEPCEPQAGVPRQGVQRTVWLRLKRILSNTKNSSAVAVKIRTTWRPRFQFNLEDPLR